MSADKKPSRFMRRVCQAKGTPYCMSSIEREESKIYLEVRFLLFTEIGRPGRSKFCEGKSRVIFNFQKAFL